MTGMFAAVALPLVTTLGAIFVLMMIARDDDERPLSLPMALLCGAIVIVLVSGAHHVPPATDWAWPAVIVLCIGLLAVGVWDQRSYLFGAPGHDRGHVAAPGRSLAGLALIAATEEFLFRGLFQSSLMNSLSGPGGAVTALFLVNLAFAATHLRHGATFALSAGFFGMIMSMTVMLSGSVWPAALTHMAWNVMIGVARRRGASASAEKAGVATPAI